MTTPPGGPTADARPGDHRRLGAYADAAGTTFAVYSSLADQVELCLFDETGGERRQTLWRTDDVWHAHLGAVGAGQAYGYRATGPVVCDPAKLLVDPYARAIRGEVRWDAALYEPGVDSAPFVPRSLVVVDDFDWQGVQPPDHARRDTIIYEAHVRGLTKRHPEVSAELRGSYAAVAHPAVVEHLHRLGVTAIELLPVHQFVHDERLVALNLRNYWGYNTLGFFAPHGGYAAGGDGGAQVDEFKTMVRELHRAGIEVILDVVYNHTAEAPASRPPLLSLRGLDAAAYYRFDGGDLGKTIDWTGCGNTVNCDHAATVRLILDSLRYWVEECHVDGFRFDLATTMCRDRGHYDPGAAVLDAVGADPVLNRVKLIAEPWDLGPDGYVLGRFPVGWSEWNAHYRDTVRDFWRGRGRRGAFAAALAGSADVFGPFSRGPLASVNFVTAHDGFTLTDLVSYEVRRNEANGEANRDGHADNRSWNCGVEGPSEDPAVRELRDRQRRNLAATLYCSVGVPMLLGGDELGHTQAGNNNAYCQDNELSWLDWERADSTMVAWVAQLAALRARHAVLRRSRWPDGRVRDGSAAVDLAWFGPDGLPLEPEDWWAEGGQPLVAIFDGRAAPGDETDAETPSLLAILVNPGGTDVTVTLPVSAEPGAWSVAVDSSFPGGGETVHTIAPGQTVAMTAHSVVVLEGLVERR